MMAKAIAARTQGDDYQGRFFWIQVCRLFEDRSKVTKVEIESNNIKSFDDVVVHYDGMFTGGESIRADYFQVKFHVTADGAFTWKGMMDPKFINASSVSLLKRMRNAQQQFAPQGWECRFNVFSPWTVHPDNEMAKFLDQTDGHIRWSVLSEGSARSKMGKIRAAWREHLELMSDEELRLVLAPIRIKRGPTFDELAETLNLHLISVGLKPVQDGTIINPYDDLARKFIQKERISFTKKDIEDICRQEGLWVGRTIKEPDAFRLGIRSFWRFAENLEDETDAMLCLLHHFNGRAPKNPSLWSNVIAPELKHFLRKNTSPSRPHHIQLQTHGTIAFIAGWELPSKAGVDIVPVQDSFTGRHVWRPNQILSEIKNQYTTWEVSNTQLKSSGSKDMVLVISATHDIEKDVLIYTQDSEVTASQFIHFRLPTVGQTSITDGSHAFMLAENLVAVVLAERRKQSISSVIHLFFSASNAFMFLFGRLAQVLGSLVLYEHDFELGNSAYCPSITLTPTCGSGTDIDLKHEEVRK